MNDEYATPDNPVEFYKREIALLVREAEWNGVIITVSQKPLLPLAMRNYETIVEAREKQ
jgi:hypothetical protein